MSRPPRNLVSLNLKWAAASLFAKDNLHKLRVEKGACFYLVISTIMSRIGMKRV